MPPFPLGHQIYPFKFGKCRLPPRASRNELRSAGRSDKVRSGDRNGEVRCCDSIDKVRSGDRNGEVRCCDSIDEVRSGDRNGEVRCCDSIDEVRCGDCPDEDGQNKVPPNYLQDNTITPNGLFCLKHHMVR
ncbi:hypothetical protein Btru_058840 [Bulinus truncatus]|nr:hypothetical protein Btru_058840 [Bulinus truncatus]